MAKEYIGSDEHWIDSVNQRYDERERYYKQMEQEQVDDRVQCQITFVECENYEHYNKNKKCYGCSLLSWMLTLNVCAVGE